MRHRADTGRLQPGGCWAYDDVRINQLGLALLHLFGRPLPEVFREHVMLPIGASEDWQWVPCDDAWMQINGQRMPSVPGGTHWGAGLSISARDQARLGQLLLQGGRWGDQQVLPASFVQRMQQACDVAPFYGWLVWLNPEGRNFPGASARSYFMMGAGGHTIWVEPALDAVVVVRWLDGGALAGFMERAAGALRS